MSHTPYYTSADNWNKLLEEILALRRMEGGRGYYYGVLSPRGGATAGIGYVGTGASAGITNAQTLAHEIGHNMSLDHAPCGSPTGVDPNFPYSNGTIGVWGYDLFAGSLMSPTNRKDLMTYCDPAWISDYSFKKALRHRARFESPELREASIAGTSSPGGKTLLLWGSTGDELRLRPAFAVNAPAALPRRDGPYRLEGFDTAGRRRFSLNFTPDVLDHGEGGGFAFTVPLEPEWADMLDRVTLSGPEGSFTLDRSGGSRAVLIRDRATGRVRGILRDWTGAIPTLNADAEVTISFGLPGGGAGGRE